jgi:hypothetical protein
VLPPIATWGRRACVLTPLVLREGLLTATDFWADTRETDCCCITALLLRAILVNIRFSWIWDFRAILLIWILAFLIHNTNNHFNSNILTSLHACKPRSQCYNPSLFPTLALSTTVEAIVAMLALGGHRDVHEWEVE